MLKRLLSALCGKKNKAPANADSAPNSASSSPAAKEEMIVAYDVNGKEFHITRSEWREKIFLPSLQQKWDNPAELYDAILTGLNDGFASDLLPAAERLVEIDPNPERCHVIQGIVLMNNSQFAAAENTLRAGIAKVGETGALLNNLAKVFAELGDDTRADETLWRAIQAEPNLENGFMWWASTQRERGGEAAYLKALRTVAALPGSWRAKCWLARHYLENNQVAVARDLYAEVMASGLCDDRAMVMISRDLGNNDEIPLIVEFFAPVYDEHKHDPRVGMNLLQAYQQLGNAEEGEKLLARMYPLGLVPYKQYLDEFAQAFHEIHKQTAQSTPIDVQNLNIQILSFTQPIWHYGLCQADWLFKQKHEEAPKVGFFALSKISNDTSASESQREDDVGRLTRAIPLYLAEATHYWSNYSTQNYFHIVEGAGPALFASQIDENILFDLVPPTMKYFVTGEIGCIGENEQGQWQISLILWDCTRRVKQACESGQAIYAELGALVLDLEQRLLAHIGLKRQQPLDPFYQCPAVEVMPIYLSALAQNFTLTLVADKHAPHSSLWGERAMLDWPFNMLSHWPSAHVPKLMAISGLSKASDYRSTALAEYRQRCLKLLHDAEEMNSPAAKLAPLVWKIFDMQEEFLAHRRNLPEGSDQGYLQWLDRVSAK